MNRNHAPRYFLTCLQALTVTDPAKLMAAARRLDAELAVPGRRDPPPRNSVDALCILGGQNDLFLYAEGIEIEDVEGDFSITELPETAHEKAEVEATP